MKSNARRDQRRTDALRHACFICDAPSAGGLPRGWDVHNATMLRTGSCLRAPQFLCAQKRGISCVFLLLGPLGHS